jgi:hypothetical protein
MEKRFKQNLLGWKVEGGEKNVSSFFSKNHQAWNLPLVTKQRCFPIDLQTLDSSKGH